MMKTGISRAFKGKPILLLWVVLSIFVFVWIPGKVTYVQWSDMAEWPLLVGKLGRLNPTQDFINLFLAFIGAAIFSLACITLGGFVFRKIRIGSTFDAKTGLAGLALMATEFLIGHGIFSVIFLTLGALYDLTPWIVTLVLAVGFLAGVRTIKGSLMEAYGSLKFLLLEMPAGKWEIAIVWLSISILAVCLFYSSTLISYDATAIYFSDAKLTAMTQHVEFFTDNVFVASVFHTVIQYTALIQLFGDQAARMFSWVSGIVFLVFCIALGERAGLSKRAIILLSAFLLTTTAFIDLTGDGKVDLISSAPAIASVYWIVTDALNKKPSISLLLLAGFFSGLAVIARPYNALLLGILIILFYLQQVFRKDNTENNKVSSFINPIIWIGAGAIGLGIFHLFANWILLNDPLDFLKSTASINPEAGPWGFDPSEWWMVRLLYPIVVTYYNSPETLGNITPLLIAFLPALLIRDIRRSLLLTRMMRILLISAIASLMTWLLFVFTVYEIRYVLFLWAILYMPVAELAALAVDVEDPVFRRIAQILVTALLAFMSIRAIYISLDRYSPVDSQGNPQCNCRFLASVNNEATLGDRVLTLSAFRYYLRSDLFACSTKHAEYNRLKEAAARGNEAFWLEAYRQGYKYLLYDYDYTTKHLLMGIIPGPDNAPDWIKLIPLYSETSDLHRTYRIEVSDPPRVSEVSCNMDSSGIWELQAPNP